MIDIKNLDKKEILELERQIQEYKKSEKSLTGYKVTFCVKFNPNNHPIETHSSICDPESFGDWLCDVIPEQIINSFDFKQPEDVSGFDVVEMTESDKIYWGGWYYGDSN